MFDSPTRLFLSRLRLSGRRASETSLYFNPRESHGAVSTDTLAWMASAFFALACNQPVWQLAMAERSFSVPGTWAFALTLLVVLTTTHFVMLGLVLHRSFAKGLLALLVVLTAFAVHAMKLQDTHIDPAALRRLAALGPGDLAGMFNQSLAIDLVFYAGLPLLVLWRIRLQPRPWPRALALRLANLLVALLVGAGSLLATAHDFDTLRRDDPALRFLITPVNFIYSLNRLFH